MGAVTQYVKSEIGLVPSDWEIKSFKEISWVNQGLQIPISKRSKYPSVKSKKYITIQFLNDGKDTEYIDDYTSSVCCTADDILMTRTGNTGIVVTGTDGVFHNNFFKINYNKKLITKDFLVYFLRSPSIQKLILAKAGTSTIPDLNHSDFYSVPILLPTINEQIQISTALASIDTYIETIEKLIAKKRDIKQATMQQLLTGKTRLPGFSGKWEERKLGLLASLITKGTTPTSIGRNFTNQGVKFIKIESLEANGNIIPEKVAYIDEATNDLLKRSQLKENDVLISIAGALGRIAVVRNEILPANTNQALAIVRLGSESLVDTTYLFYYLNSDRIRRHFGAVNVQAAQANLSLQNISDVNIAIPQFSEQVEIAQVLSGIDQELFMLNKRLEKLNLLKQGMMQELLTGRIRLI